MASCPKCGAPKLKRRKDGFHCGRHGLVQKKGPPVYRMLTEQEKEMRK